MSSKSILILSVLLLFVSVSGAAVNDSSQSVFQEIEEHNIEDQSIEEQKDANDLNLQEYLKYVFFWVIGQIAIIYYLGNMLFAKSDLTKVVSIVGIMLPVTIIANFIPLIGLFISLWAYAYLIKFYFESTYLMSAVIVVPLLIFEFVLWTAIFG